MATPLMHDPAITTPEEIIERGIFPTTMKYFAVMVDDEMAACQACASSLADSTSANSFS